MARVNTKTIGSDAMDKRLYGLVVGAIAIGMTACSTIGEKKPAVVAVLESRSGSTVTGTATVFSSPQGPRMHIELAGLSPGSEHGMHVHDKGDCSAPDAMSAGGHFNPDGAAHGRADLGPHHLGDLGSVVADSQGRVSADVTLTELTATEGPRGLIGHSLVVHRDRDDFVTQPAGNAGPRVACGVFIAP
jgi:Cu-Zn family superoxide dismutase